MNPKTELKLMLSRNIRRVRIEKLFTVEKLANKSGFSYSQVSRIELEKLNPTAYTLFVLSVTLDVCPTEFF